MTGKDVDAENHLGGEDLEETVQAGKGFDQWSMGCRSLRGAGRRRAARGAAGLVAGGAVTRGRGPRQGEG